MSKDKIENAKTKEGFENLKLSKAKKVAGGTPAVLSSLSHISKESGINGLKVLINLNQKGGIDCPGCAWPDPDDERSKLGEYCENGAKAIAEEVSAKKLDTRFFKENTVDDLAALSDFEIGKKGRIAQPMYLPTGANHYQEISWENAFSIIGDKLNNLDSPNEAIFYTSGRTSNEAAFLYQLFVRAYGTNNLPDCSNMCHESSGVALSETVGIGKGSVTLDDFNHAEVIMVMGQNPGTNHPRMLTALQKAKKKGAKIVTINPLKEAGLLNFSHPQKPLELLGAKTKLSDQYLQVKINGDHSLLQVINHLLVLEHDKSNDVLDTRFIAEKTNGFDEYIDHLRSIDTDLLIEQSGIPLDQIKQLVKLLSHKSKIIVCWAMGLTQHHNAVDTIKEVVNLLLLKGSIAKEGAGTCPVRGHSNVQGDRTVGIVERPSDEFLDKLKEVFNFEPPREHGYDTVNAIKAMHDGKAKFFFGMGGNFLSASPDTMYTAQALINCDLTVHVSTKLNRSHLVNGKEALILPCLGRTDKDIKQGKEQFVSVENSMGVVHSSQGILAPVSDQLKSEVEIVSGMAMTTLSDSSIEWNAMSNDYDLIRNKIAMTIPGFENYNERVRKPSGFYLPNPARSGAFRKPDGRAEFSIAKAEKIKCNPDEYIMMTIRSHDQFNTTIYGLNDRYRGISNERRVVLMNKRDMESVGLEAKSVVDIINSDKGETRKAPNFQVVPYDMPSGCVATYFPEANVLIPIDSTAKYSNTPTSKSVVVKINKK